METVDLEQFGGERIRRLHADEYERLIEAGVFQDEKVELLEGLLVEMSPIGMPHAWLVTELMRLLVLATVDLPVSVIPQGTIRMGDYSMPEPDICVVPRPTRLVRPIGGLLVIEVSDSSLDKDRRLKTPIYARAMVPEYWIVDAKHQCVHVHTDPRGDAYHVVTVVRRDGVLRPTKLPGASIVIEKLFELGS